MNSIKENNLNIHAGHRKRMKNVYLKSRFDAFEEHEVLEFILFYALPYINTNPLAHVLISKFGSLQAVFEASISDLESVPGVGHATALFLKAYYTLGEFCIRCCAEDTHRKKADMLESSREIDDFLICRYSKKQEPFVAFIFLNNRNEVIKVLDFVPMKLTSPFLDLCKVIKDAVNEMTSSVILAFGNADNFPFPKIEEKTMAESVSVMFREIGITVRDVLMLSDGKINPVFRRK